MEERNSFKKISVVPNREDFAEAIVSRIEHQAAVTVISKGCAMRHLRPLYKRNVWAVAASFHEKLTRVTHEFPSHGQIHHSYDHLLHMLYSRYMFALHQVKFADRVICRTARGLMRLLMSKDCDSLGKCKSLLLDALGCLFTLAMKIIPTLTYLDDVRQFMASRTETNLGDDFDASTLTETQYTHMLAKEGWTFPRTVDVHNVSSFVNPNDRRWLEELEREHGLRFKDDAKLSHNPKEEDLAACHYPIMKALLT